MTKKTFIGGQYRPLSKEQLETIHESALTIMEEVGFKYDSELNEIVDLIEQKGVAVDRDKSRFSFNRDLVLEAISQAPKRVILYSRDGENDVDLNGNQVHFGTGGTVTQVIDLETGLRRPSTVKDFYQLARLTDQLQNLDLLVRPSTPTDVPPDRYDANATYAAMKGTKKHFNTGIFMYEGFADALEVASIVAGGLDKLQEKPFISFHTTFMISPLKLSSVPTRIFVEAAKNGIPVSLCTGPMAGSTAPITLAGTLTLMHAELMSGIVISQLVNPGTPVMYTSFPSPADMGTLQFICGTAETGMMTAAVHQLARHIDVPNFVSAGMTDSKVIDAQAGWESAMALFAAAMGGNNVIRHAVGIIESAMTLSYEHYVINDEIIGMVKRILTGIEVNKEQIALDIIKSVGPGRDYLSSPHTLKHLRSGFHFGNGITNRDILEVWEKKGSDQAVTRANKMVREMLSKPEKSCISSEADRRIREKFEILL